MQLPNPFSANNVTTVSPSPSNHTNNLITINPGPGLPQAQIPVYKYSPSKYTNLSYNSYRNGQGGGGGRHHCDRCDKSFWSQEQLEAHVSEHIPCGIDGCTFVAHPKIVEKHISMQHETGLALKIMKLTSPEEILKWREERKRLLTI